MRIVDGLPAICEHLRIRARTIRFPDGVDLHFDDVISLLDAVRTLDTVTDLNVGHLDPGCVARLKAAGVLTDWEDRAIDFNELPPWTAASLLEFLASRIDGHCRPAELGHAIQFSRFGEVFGAAPELPRAAAGCRRISLPTSTETGTLHQTLRKRRTTRTFALDQRLTVGHLSSLLFQVFAISQVRSLDNGLEIGRRTSPSGGSIQSVEAYIIVRECHGVPSGIYRYGALDHSLVDLASLGKDEACALMESICLGQPGMSSAAFYVILVADFKRLLWKYRQHQKALHVALLDAGHLSMTLQLVAQEAGLGSFVSAYMNDAEVEVRLGLDPTKNGAMCFLGVGQCNLASEYAPT